MVLATNLAGIVIQNSTGELITRSVEFEEAELTAEELLVRSGFKMTIAEFSFGKSVCFLHDEGALDPSQCFDHPQQWFWNFFQKSSTPDWVAASTGISSATVVHGDLIGFAFGAFDTVQLPPMTF